MARILVADDSWFQRKQIIKFLTADGHETIEAENGKDTLKKALFDKPDCVLLDLLMPEMNGIEVLEFLKKEKLEVPVVVFSADIQDSTRRMCFELGVAEFLNKPINEEELRGAIDRALALERRNGG